jgi:hypothetical protein
MGIDIDKLQNPEGKNNPSGFDLFWQKLLLFQKRSEKFGDSNS